MRELSPRVDFSEIGPEMDAAAALLGAKKKADQRISQKIKSQHKIAMVGI